MKEVDNLRFEIDNAIDKWLLAQGFTANKIGDLDFSFIDDELNTLVTQLNNQESEQ